MPTSGAPFSSKDTTQLGRCSSDSLEEAIPVASIWRCNLCGLLCGLLNLLNNLLDGSLGSLNNRLGCLGRCGLLKNFLLDLDGLGGASLLLNRQHLGLLSLHHSVAVFLGAVCCVHRGALITGGGIGGGVHHRSMVDQRGMVDNGGMVDNRSRGIGRGNGGSGDLDNWSRGNNRGNPNHRGRCNLDQRGSLVSSSRQVGVDSLALVGDGRVVALGPGSVGDDLDSAVGKVDTVLSTCVCSVSLLGLGEHRVAVACVVHSILVIVDGRQTGIGFNWDRSSNRVQWPPGGKSKQGWEEHQLGHDAGVRVQGGRSCR